MKARFSKLLAAAAATLACAGLASAPAALGATSSGPSLALPDLSFFAPTDQQVWTGYTRLYTDVQIAPDPSTGDAVDSIELVVPGVSDQTVPAPSGGSGAVTFTLPTAYPHQVSGYVIAIDASGATSEQAPVLINPAYHGAHLTYDSGATHEDIPQLEGDDAHITVIPQWYDGPTQTVSWLTDVSVDFDLRPVGARSGLHAYGPVTVDLHDADGTAFNPGEHQLTICATDNDGDRQCQNPAVYVVNPITASWSVGTTQPDTPTTVTATIHNQTTSAIHSLALRLRDGTVVASALDPAGATPTISSTMTFAPGGNSPNVVVALANGNTYRVYDEVASLIHVDSTLVPPKDPSWNENATFHARALSSRGTAQSGLVLHLQSRAPGSSAWVSHASAATGKNGQAVMVVPADATGTASWRVVSSPTKIQMASASTIHTVRVRAAFGHLPASKTVRARHTTRYKLAIRPAISGMRVAVEYRRLGTSHWTTLNHIRAAHGTAALAIRLAKAGRYRMRIVVEQTRSVAATASASWALHVVR